jgi:hypothetical protein|tara:strand:- start:169 stop:588 length:420 start_codon:yes stop_codon:yes gene_type:complete
MATTNANLTITSDIINGMPINITKSMVMRKLGSTVGLEETSGLRTKKFTATDAIVVIEEDEFTNTKASKVYMRNTGSSKADFFYVAKHASAAAADTDAETIGKLYGGDWMLIPYAADVNITVAPNTAETMTLEYMVFVE